MVFIHRGGNGGVEETVIHQTLLHFNSEINDRSARFISPMHIRADNAVFKRLGHSLDVFMYLHRPMGFRYTVVLYFPFYLWYMFEMDRSKTLPNSEQTRQVRPIPLQHKTSQGKNTSSAAQTQEVKHTLTSQSYPRVRDYAKGNSEKHQQDHGNYVK